MLKDANMTKCPSLPLLKGAKVGYQPKQTKDEFKEHELNSQCHNRLHKTRKDEIGVRTQYKKLARENRQTTKL